MVGALSIAFSLLAAAGIAWYIGMLDFNLSREPRRSKSGGSSSDTGELLFRITSHHYLSLSSDTLFALTFLNGIDWIG